MVRVGMQGKVLPDITQDQVRFAVSVHVGYGQGFPPSIEVGEVGVDLFKMIILPGEDTGRHPFTGDDQLFCGVARYVRPGGGGDHADAGDVGVLRPGDIGEMSFAIVDEQVAGGGGAIFMGYAAAPDEQVLVSVVVEVT